jgi:hypothetical protein
MTNLDWRATQGTLHSAVDVVAIICAPHSWRIAMQNRDAAGPMNQNGVARGPEWLITRCAGGIASRRD